MPYIIETKRTANDVSQGYVVVTTRRAVATLDEAQNAAQLVIDNGPPITSKATWQALCGQVVTIGESGGKVGPLPDGTVIEVRRVLWSELAADLGIELRHDPPTQDGDYLHERQARELAAVIDEYNAPVGYAT